MGGIWGNCFMPGPSPAAEGCPGSLGSLRVSAHPKKSSSQLLWQPQEAAKAQQSRAWKEESQECFVAINSPKQSSSCEIWEPVLLLTQIGIGTPAKPPSLGRAGRSAIPLSATPCSWNTSGHTWSPACHIPRWYLHPGEQGLSWEPQGAAESPSTLARTWSSAAHPLHRQRDWSRELSARLSRVEHSHMNK